MFVTVIALKLHFVGKSVIIWTFSNNPFPITPEIMETEYIWSPPTFATGCHFLLGTVALYSASPDLLAKCKG